MDLFTNGDFWTIVAVVVSALGVYRAEKADRRRERQEMEKRIEAGEQRLAEQIGARGQELTKTRRELTEQISARGQELTETRRELMEAISARGQELTETRRELMEAISARGQDLTETRRDLTEQISARGQELTETRRELTEALSTQRQEFTEAISVQKQETLAAMTSQKQEIGRRIDRLEDRFDNNHREVTAGLAEVKAAVSALNAKLDERSHPRGLEGAGLSSAGADVAASVVRETPAPYSADEPKGESEGTPGSGRSRPREESPD